MRRRTAADWLLWQSGPQRDPLGVGECSQRRRALCARRSSSAERIRLALVAWSVPEGEAWWTVLRVDYSVTLKLQSANPDNQRAI